MLVLQALFSQQMIKVPVLGVEMALLEEAS
jgi:hypothetical protein